MKKLLLISALILSACAQQPDKIAAIDVAGDPYKGMSCRELSAQHLQTTQELEKASAAQKKAATGDAFGVFLLGLPLSSMSGNDQEATIAVAKGRINALDAKLLQKNCS